MPLRRTPIQTESTCLKRRTTQTDLHPVTLESQSTEPQQGTTKRVKGSVTATAQEELLISAGLLALVGTADNRIC